MPPLNRTKGCSPWGPFCTPVRGHHCEPIDTAEVLPISQDYFRLRRPLDRRLYELARKHCGSKDKWRISIDKLQKKCGSKQERKSFVRHLRETVEADHLPDYTLMLD
ncbi:MAG: replication initiator protein A, partial [Rhodomicrobium sp.]